MAESSIADMLTQSVLQTNQKVPDLAGAVSSGVQLASQIEQVNLQRQQIEQAKQQQEMAKIAKIGEWYDHAAKMPEGGARKAFVSNYIPQAIKALGMADRIDPTVVKMFDSDPTIVPYLKDLLERRQIDMATLQKSLVDPPTLAALTTKINLDKFGGEQALRGALSDYQQTLSKAGTLGVQEEGKFGRTQLAGELGLGKQVQAQQATPQVEAAKKTADIFAGFTASGGKANVENNLGKLEKALKSLETGAVKTGSIPTAIAADWPRIMAVADPKLKALIDDVRGGINMKAALADPNPTEKQINQILSRAIDPSLPTEENAAKLRNMIQEIKNDVTAKQKEFIKQKLMTPEEAWKPGKKTGYVPPEDMKMKFKALSPAAKELALQGLAKQQGVSVEELRKALGE